MELQLASWFWLVSVIACLRDSSSKKCHRCGSSCPFVAAVGKGKSKVRPPITESFLFFKKIRCTHFSYFFIFKLLGMGLIIIIINGFLFLGDNINITDIVHPIFLFHSLLFKLIFVRIFSI